MQQPRTYLQRHKHRGSHNRLPLGTLQPCKSGPERISNIMIENSSIFYLFQSRSLVVLGCVQMCPIKIKKWSTKRTDGKIWTYQPIRTGFMCVVTVILWDAPQTKKKRFKNKNTTALCLPKTVSSAATLADLLLAVRLLNLNMMCDKIEFIGFLCVSTTATKIHSETTT